MKSLRLALALVAFPLAARGDGAWLRENIDSRGRVVSVAPQQNTTVSMRYETVSLVPYLQGSDVMLYVNVRYVFVNPGAASDLLVGFPEMRGGITDHSCPSYCGAPGETWSFTPHATIEAFRAEAGGRPLAVRTLPGRGEYTRWHTFTVPFGAGETSLRNDYVARPGVTRSASNTSQELRYDAEYILHTGSQWAGSIGSGDITVWNGRSQRLRHFTDLRPTPRDDVHVPLDVTVTPSPGRPLFLWNYGNGAQAETVEPRLEGSAVLRESSHRADDTLGHLGAMALDGDPSTAWIDNGPRGGIGEWLQVPTHRMGRIRGLSVRSGARSPGVSRIRRLRLTCFDLEGNDRTLTELESQSVELSDATDAQSVPLPTPLGSCQAVRFTVEQLHGASGDHATLATLDLVE